MKITVLAENTSVCENIGAEHGLSLFIETKDTKLLFDMGQTDLFAENAAKLGADLSAVGFAVLSHGHYDHGGGLWTFLSLNKTAPVFLSPYAFEPHFNALGKDIGLDKRAADGDRFVFCEGVTEIAPGITLFGGKCGSPLDTPGAKGMKTEGEKGLVPDDFRHEQYLLIKEDGRKFLFSGCSHRGASEIATYFSPDVFIGGFHFSKTDPETAEGKAFFRREAEALLGACGKYYTCHCTGKTQFEVLKKYMGGRLVCISSGETIEI